LLGNFRAKKRIISAESQVFSAVEVLVHELVLASHVQLVAVVATVAISNASAHVWIACAANSVLHYSETLP